VRAGAASRGTCPALFRRELKCFDERFDVFPVRLRDEHMPNAP
jgi:hypothetical protein